MALDDLADRDADLGGVVQRAALDALGDGREIGLDRRKQRLALARALGCDERVATDDEALPRELLGADLGEVVLVKERRLEGPVRTRRLTCGALSAVIQSIPCDSRIASRLARVTIPRSATQTSSERPKRCLSFASCAGTV